MAFPQTIDTMPTFSVGQTLILADHYNLHQDILLRVKSVQEYIGTSPNAGEPVTTVRARLWDAEGKITALQAAQAATSTIPVGVVLPYFGASAPTAEWCICDGRAWPGNASATIKTLTGSSTNAPDLRDRFIAGRDASTSQTFASTARTGGVKEVTLSAAQSGSPAHAHTATAAYTDVNHTHSGTTGGADRAAGQQHTHTITVNAGGAHQHQVKLLDGDATAGKDGQGVDSSPNQGWNNYSPNGETMGDDGSHGHSASAGYTNTDHLHAFTSGYSNQAGVNHTHGITVNNSAATAATSPHSIIPQYYALVYIIKIV